MDIGMYYVAQAIANAAPPEQSLKVAEAGMNLAGHPITDPYIKGLMRQRAYGEISFEEYQAACIRHILGGN